MLYCFVPTLLYQCILISRSPSETRAVASDFWVIMPSVGDDDYVAGLLTHKAHFVHLIVCCSRDL